MGMAMVCQTGIQAGQGFGRQAAYRSFVGQAAKQTKPEQEHAGTDDGSTAVFKTRERPANAGPIRVPGLEMRQKRGIKMPPTAGAMGSI